VKWVSKPFPTKVGRHVSLPHTGELMAMPMFKQASVELFMNLACNLQKHLFNNAPITRKYRNVFIDSYVQFLYPGTSPQGEVFGLREPDMWHIDAESGQREIYHLFQTESSCKTIFSKDEVELDLGETFNNVHITRLLNKQKGVIVEQEVPFNQFVSYTDHPHRTKVADSYDLRFVFKVTESNHRKPVTSEEQALRTYTEIYDHKTNSFLKTFLHHKEGIELVYPFDVVGGKNNGI
jgi:hypothetical protein